MAADPKRVYSGLKGYLTKLTGRYDKYSEQEKVSVNSTIAKTITKLDDLAPEIYGQLSDEKEVIRVIEEHQTYVDRLNGFIKLSQITPSDTGDINVKLPTIDIPKFSGNYTDWIPFWETYQCLIHNSSKLQDIEKFNYLRTYLEGNALRTIEGLPRIGANYKHAISLLQETYGDKQLIINTHMKKLFNVRTVQVADVSNLKSFYDYVQIQIRALKTMGVDQSTFDAMTLPLLLSKLPNYLKMKFAEKTINTTWTVEELLQLIHQEIKIKARCGVMLGTSDRIQQSPNVSHINHRHKQYSYPPRPERNTLNTFSAQSAQTNCSFCQGGHKENLCKQYGSTNSRRQRAYELRLCYKCLRTGHNQSTCQRSCTHCQGYHHVSLCEKLNNREEPQHIRPLNGPKYTPQQTVTPVERGKQLSSPTRPRFQSTKTLNAINEKQAVLLQTAKVNLISKEGNLVEVNALFDKGSQQSYVSQEVSDKLRFHTRGKKKVLINVFGSESCLEQNCTSVDVRTMSDKGEFTFPALTINKICNDINQCCSEESGNLEGIDLSNANIHGQIDLLIGCDIYWEIVTGEIKKEHEGLVAMKSIYGWLVSGTTNGVLDKPVTSLLCTAVSTKTDAIESVTESSIDDDLTLQVFENSIKYKDDRYTVHFPWRIGMRPSVSYFDVSLSRLHSLVAKLKRENLYERYEDVIKTYKEKGYIESCTTSDTGLYLPHHGVVKEDKATTKIRVVFDGSTKLQSALSLNECLYKGPALLNDLAGMLVRFRFGAVAIIGDLREAFLQIRVDETERDSLKFLWIENNKLVAYRFTRLPFGLSCSPFILTATLRHHFLKHNTDLHRHFYVDDFIYTGDSPQQVTQAALEARTLCKKAGFDLHKWCTNNDDIKRVKEFEIDEQSNSASVLGIKWNTQSDTIQLKEIKEISYSKVTKRIALASIARNFDPLGLFLPVIVRLRIFFQGLAGSKIDWDAPLTKKQEEDYNMLMEDCSTLASIELPRHTPLRSSDASLHIFCDASSKAYGACAYLAYMGNDEPKCYLLRAKARVKPLTPVSIPRLELGAAVVGAKLYSDMITDCEKLKGIPVYLWSDSIAVLGWIKGTKQWPTFVENRVAFIRTLRLSDRYFYITTEENPADVLSRGCSTEKLRHHKLWWNGPTQYLLDTIKVQTEKPVRAAITTTCHTTLDDSDATHEDIFCVDRHSSLGKATRVVCIVSHFIDSCLKRKPKRHNLNNWRCNELSKAERLLLIQEQSKWFHEDIEHLKSKGKVHMSSKLAKLNVKLENDLICLQTRYQSMANLPNHLILLSNQSWLTTLIIRSTHLINLHQGTSHTLSALRTKYWIIQGKKTVKKVLNACIECKKVTGQPYAVSHWAPMPEFRCTPTHPFLHLGIDFAGPILVKANITSRSQSKIKAYICLFVCATSRAIHLELVLDLSTKSFLDALQRFIARRGTPSYICSDNGTTFVAASKEVASFINGQVNDIASQNFFYKMGIRWRFIPPRAPWWGGYYERMVQLVKRCLKKVVGNSSLSYLQLETVLIKIEGIINDRPLTNIGEAAEEERTISPSDLILGRKSTENVKGDSEETSTFIDGRLEYQRIIYSQFWNLFQREYLLTLRKFKSSKQGLKHEAQVGDIVHVRDEGPRASWKIGRIVETLTGNDHTIRAAKVTIPIGGSNSTTINRSVTHLYPLEVGNEGVDKKAIKTDQPLKTDQRKPSSFINKTNTLSTGLMCMLTMLSLSIIETSAKNVTTSCAKLSCMREDFGELRHYNIYRRPDWIELRVWICAREVTKCTFSENIIGSKTKTCVSAFEIYSRAACKLIGATKSSTDGKLSKVATTEYATQNVVEEKFAWFSTNVEIVKNTALIISTVRTDGKRIDTNYPTLRECWYADGHCALLNKTMVWKSPCFYNLFYLHSEVCYHKDKKIHCPEDDFDEIGREEVCDGKYIKTAQGLYLSQNSSKSVHTVSQHRFNAAVIQHLQNGIELLQKQVRCLAMNAKCVKTNERIIVEHRIVDGFNHSHRNMTLSSYSIDELIKERVRESFNEKLNINSIQSKSLSWMGMLWLTAEKYIGYFVLIIIGIWLTYSGVRFIIRVAVTKRPSIRQIGDPYPLTDRTR